MSSRGDRAKQKATRPEDFMDDEDIQDLKDSRTLIDTTEEMDLTGGSKANVEETEYVTDSASVDTTNIMQLHHFCPRSIYASSSK